MGNTYLRFPFARNNRVLLDRDVLRHVRERACFVRVLDGLPLFLHRGFEPRDGSLRGFRERVRALLRVRKKKGSVHLLGVYWTMAWSATGRVIGRNSHQRKVRTVTGALEVKRAVCRIWESPVRPYLNRQALLRRGKGLLLFGENLFKRRG